jgi:hypothetical protein
MKRTGTGILVALLLLVVGGLCASPAPAGGSALGLLNDASDGVVDGSYNAAQVRAALVVVRSDPAYMQYSDIEGVMVDYLASLTGTPWPGATQQTGPGGATPGQEATPGHEGTSGKSATPGDATNRATPNDGTDDATPEGSAAPATTSPVPSVTAWEQIKVRLAAVPWFFAVAMAALVAGVVLLRRRRAD